MADGVKPTNDDLAIARSGVVMQYEAMFDANTRDKLAELGIDKFIDYTANRIAHQEAYLRFYANCLHPKSE